MPRKSDGKGADFVFLPLGGVGEIGMNLYLYGYGRGRAREWLIVDMGITFGGDAEPGIDVILPDIRFLQEERHNIVGLLLTHAHEDHFGAVADLWPQLGGVPVYATPFTAEMLKMKLAELGRLDGFPLKTIPLGHRCSIGPFDVELITMSHSIPEPSAVVISTPLGTALHTGDWKLDDNPLTSAPTNSARLKALGEDGISALICNSTNAVREGISASESDVAATLERADPRGAATGGGHHLRLQCRAHPLRGQCRPRRRARTRGGRPRHVSRHRGARKPPAISTCRPSLPSGDRAAQAAAAQSRGAVHRQPGRDARGDGPHCPGRAPDVKLKHGDWVIYSSRTIPGNEKAVGRVQNALADMGVEVITDQDAPSTSRAIPAAASWSSFMAG